MYMISFLRKIIGHLNSVKFRPVFFTSWMTLYWTIFHMTHMTHMTDIYIYRCHTACYFWSWGDGCCFCNPCAISEDRLVTSWRVLALQWSALTALKAAESCVGCQGGWWGWMVGEDQRKRRRARTCIRFAWRLRKLEQWAPFSPSKISQVINLRIPRSKSFPSGPVQQLGE